MDDREPVIGIDLGTTNSVVATVRDGPAVVLGNRVGQNTTPSVVAIAPGGKRLVGQLAKRQAITNPENTVFAAKRLIGRKFSSPTVQRAKALLPYGIVAGEHDDVRIHMGDRDWSLPEVSALVLRELKLDAEAFFGRPVTKAIITVPAYFNDGQRQATKDAGAIAGLEVLRIINEPTAAALAYGFGKSVRGKIAVFDLGGGTLDVSVLQVADNVFEVVATGGDTFLGGEDWDNRIIEWLATSFSREHGVDLRTDRLALQRLKDAAEKAKQELSTTKTAAIRLPFLHTPAGGGNALSLETELSRDKLEALTLDLTERAVSIAARVLEDAKVRPEDLKEVVLVGGMTRMPAIQEAVRRFFRKEPCKGVHPDEVVALGAAVHGHALVAPEEQSQVLLLDVTPHSLGVAIAGGYVRRLIPKNTTVPTATKQIFNTSRDDQTTVRILVLQGESEVAHQNELLGEFVLGGLRKASRGEVEIEVTFEIDSEGLVSVSAKDRGTGKKAAVTLMASGGLTPEELKRILESQHDDLLDAKAEEGIQALRAALQAKIRDVKAILPLVKSDTAAAPIVKAAEAQLARVSWALSSNDPNLAVKAGEELSASLELLKGVYHRLLGGRR